jgi:hypothetical protein
VQALGRPATALMVGVRVQRWVVTRLFPNHMQHNFSCMRTYSVFEEVDALPGTEYEAAFDNRYR